MLLPGFQGSFAIGGCFHLEIVTESLLNAFGNFDRSVFPCSKGEELCFCFAMTECCASFVSYIQGLIQALEIDIQVIDMFPITDTMQVAQSFFKLFGSDDRVIEFLIPDGFDPRRVDLVNPMTLISEMITVIGSILHELGGII